MRTTLDWTHALEKIGKDGLARERAANEDELARIAKALEIPEVKSLQTRYDIRPRAGGAYRLKGDLSAEVVQTCVVTLTPLPAKIEERFEAEFWPEDSMPVPPQGEIDASAAPDHELIEDNAIAAGRVVFETLAAALDPYPRSTDAPLEWSDPADDGDRQSPFAELEKLKPKE